MRIGIRARAADFSLLEKIAFFLYFLVEVNIELFVYRTLYMFSALFLAAALLGSGKARIRLTKYSTWIFLWALVVAISMTYSIAPSTTFTAVLTILARALVFFAIISRVRNIELFEIMLKILITVEFFNVVYILSRIDIFSGIQRVGFRSIDTNSDAMWNSNAISSDLALCIMCLAGLLHNKAVRKRWLSYLVLILFIIVCILCGSRTGLLLIIGTPVLWLFLSSDRSNRIKRFSSLILIVVLAYYVVFEIPIIYNILGIRIERLFYSLMGQVVKDRSINERNDLILYGLAWFRQKPILGYGMYTFKEKIGTVLYGRNIYSHNNYVEILFGTGVIGLAFYYWFYLFLLIRAFKNRANYRHWAIIASGVIIMMVAEYATVSFKKFSFQFAIALLFLLLAMDQRGSAGSMNEKYLGSSTGVNAQNAEDENTKGDAEYNHDRRL